MILIGSIIIIWIIHIFYIYIYICESWWVQIILNQHITSCREYGGSCQISGHQDITYLLWLLGEVPVKLNATQGENTTPATGSSTPTPYHQAQQQQPPQSQPQSQPTPPQQTQPPSQPPQQQQHPGYPNYSAGKISLSCSYHFYLEGSLFIKCSIGGKGESTL